MLLYFCIPYEVILLYCNYHCPSDRNCWTASALKSLTTPLSHPFHSLNCVTPTSCSTPVTNLKSAEYMPCHASTSQPLCQVLQLAFCPSFKHSIHSGIMQLATAAPFHQAPTTPALSLHPPLANPPPTTPKLPTYNSISPPSSQHHHQQSSITQYMPLVSLHLHAVCVFRCVLSYVEQSGIQLHWLDHDCCSRCCLL